MPVVATTAQGLSPAARSRAMAASKASGRMPKSRIVFDQTHIVAAESGQQRSLVHRAVALRRSVYHQRLLLGLQSSAAEAVVGGAFSRAHSSATSVQVDAVS